MLPLIYCCHRLSTPNDNASPSIRSRRTPAASMFERRLPTRFRRVDALPITALLWIPLRKSMTTPLRVFRTLYNLGRAMDDGPNMLYLRKTLTSSRYPPIDDDQQTVSIVGSEETGRDGYEVAAPATASQVYHAAIVNGTTLDDLLAVFEVSDGAPTINGSLGAGNVDTASHYVRYRNSSIQTTPDALATPRKASVSLRDDNTAEDRNYGQLVKVTGEESANREGGSCPPVAHCCSISENVQRAQSCEDALPHHLGCPTFARRQAQSRLPRKSQPKDVHARNELQKGAAPATMVSSEDSPSKRNRLQRRPRAA